MRHVDLCSGIGGFALAAEWAGWQTVGFCEIEPWCRDLLRRHWPGIPCHDDLKTLTPDIVRGWLETNDGRDGHAGESLGAGADWILTGGYPCQPFSAAGKRQGEDDPRHLWPWIRDLVAGLGPDAPAWVCLENVRGHVSMGLDRVLADLDDLGYASTTWIVPAAGVGALHKRDRVWIVGHRPASLHDPEGA